MRAVPRVVAGALAVLALIAVGLGAALSRPAPVAGAPAALAAGSAPPVRATLFCPDLRRLPGTLQTGVVIGTSTPGAGSVTAVPAGGGAAARPRVVLGAGARTGVYDSATQGPVVLRATGALTGGLVAEQIGRGNKTTDRGWAEARCEPPRTDQWFVGAATTPGDTSAVILANPGDTRAIVTITVLTPQGLVAVPAGSNLVLAPHATPPPIPLVDLAPGAIATAVEVRTTIGLVSAAVRDVRADGTTLLGTDYVPVSEPNATLAIPGLPGTVVGTPPARTLYVGDPGADPTTATVTVTTDQGTFVPTGLDAVEVAGQSVRAIPLGGLLGDAPAMVTVASQRDASGAAPPVVAGVLVDATSPKAAVSRIHEIAYLGAVGPLPGASVIPTVRDPVDTDSVLIASAPTSAATLNITAIPPAGGRRLVFSRAIPAGETITVSTRSLRVPDTSSVTVTPTRGSGPVYVARLIEEDGALGPLLSAFQVAGQPPTRPVSAVVPQPLGGPASP